MDDKILKEMCQKYNEEEKVMDILVNISLQEGFSKDTTNTMIDMFYNK